MKFAFLDRRVPGKPAPWCQARSSIARDAEAHLDRLFDLLQVQDLLKQGGEGISIQAPQPGPRQAEGIHRLSCYILRSAAVG